MSEDTARKAWHESGLKNAMLLIAQKANDIREQQAALDDFCDEVCDQIDQYGLPPEVENNPVAMNIILNVLGWEPEDADD